jgi:hypothetical protein
VIALAILVLGLGCGTSPPSPADAGRPPDAGSDSGGCAPGATLCDGTTFARCASDGVTRAPIATCPERCDPIEGCVPCVLGMHRCTGAVSEVCVAGGVWVTLRDCDLWGTTCGGDGFCDDACSMPERTGGYTGCEYVAAGLPAGLVTPTTVNVTNPGDTEVHVEFWRGRERVSELDLAPRAIQGVVIEPLFEEGTSIDRERVVNIRATAPITVTQYTPFESGSSYSADASLLLPAHALGREHRIASYLPLSFVAFGVVVDESFPAAGFAFANRGFFTVIGSPHGTSQVTITPSAPIARDASGRIPPVAAGEPFEFLLEPGEAVHVFAARHPTCDSSRPGFTGIGIRCVTMGSGDTAWTECRDDYACAEPDYDLTGTLVESDVPVAVFGAHECAFLPFDRWACDHLQEQMPPLDTWGLDHVSMTVGPAGGGGPNLVRVIAAQDGTSIAIDPPQDGVSAVSLDRGEWTELVAHGLFRITGDKPILVAQYLWGQGSDGGEGLRGDPSLWVVPPVEQFQRSYEIALPVTYSFDNARNFLLVVRPKGTWTAIDMFPTDAFATELGDWEAGVVTAEPGIHSVAGEENFALIAIGLSNWQSYATPAGRGFVPRLE